MNKVTVCSILLAIVCSTAHAASEEPEATSALQTLLCDAAPCSLPAEIAQLITAFAAERLQRFKLVGHTSCIAKLRFTPNGDRIVSADVGGTLIVWDTQSGQRLYSLEGHENSVWTFILGPNSQLIAIASVLLGQPCHIRDIDTGAIRYSIAVSDPAETIRPTSFSPDGQWLAYVRSRAPGLHLEELASGQKKILPCEHEISSVFLANNKLFVVCSDGSQQFWNTETEQLERTISDQKLACYKNRSFYITHSNTESRPIDVYDLQSHNKILSLQDSTNQYQFFSLDCVGRRLFAYSEDGHAHIWDVRSGDHTQLKKRSDEFRVNAYGRPLFTYSPNLLCHAYPGIFVVYKLVNEDGTISNLAFVRGSQPRRGPMLKLLSMDAERTTVAIEKWNNLTNSHVSIELYDLVRIEEDLDRRIERRERWRTRTRRIKNFFKGLRPGQTE